jgi:3-dehydroquinate synthase
VVKKIKVSLKENPYNIIIGGGSFFKLNEEIARLKKYKDVLAVIDENVMKHYGAEIKRVLKTSGQRVEIYTLKSGEKAKSFTELNKIYAFLLEKKFGRDSLIIAIGGGVTGDLAGYAASTFMRGVDYIQIPTTLLSAVDSSVGGKTGINFNNTKNIIGSFYQPKLVIVDPVFLKTLPKEEITCGIGEIIKYGFLADSAFFNYLKKNINKIYQLDYKIITSVIHKSLVIKSQVVIQDEKESSVRKILNLGHTFAHAYESGLKFKIKHGEAVIAGVTAALHLSNKMGFITEEKLAGLLSLPSIIPINGKLKGLNKENLISFMQSDKKNTEGKIKFVLIRDAGELIINVEAAKKDVIYALEKTVQ